MKQFAVVVVFLLLLGAGAYWILKDRPEAESEYGDALLRSMDRGKAERVRGNLRTMHQALTGYMTAEGTYPQTSDVGELGRMLRPYVARVDTNDPWGTPYRYESTGSSYTIHSAGQDTSFGTADDIVSRDGHVEATGALKPLNL
jgi:hypothetical protein